MEEQAPSILAPILEYGIIGSLLIIVGYFAYKKDKALKEVQDQRIKDQEGRIADADKRTDDAKAVVDKLISLTDKWNQTINQQIATFKATKDALSEIRKVMDKVQDTMIGCKHNKGT